MEDPIVLSLVDPPETMPVTIAAVDTATDPPAPPAPPAPLLTAVPVVEVIVDVRVAEVTVTLVVVETPDELDTPEAVAATLEAARLAVDSMPEAAADAEARAAVRLSAKQI